MKNRKMIYVCSPLRAETQLEYTGNISRARAYCKMIMKAGYIPIAPHVYFTQFTNDYNPNERAECMEAGLQLLDFCNELWVFGKTDKSEGMRREMRHAAERCIPIRDGAQALRLEWWEVMT